MLQHPMYAGAAVGPGGYSVAMAGPAGPAMMPNAGMLPNGGMMPTAYGMSAMYNLQPVRLYLCEIY